MSEFYPNIITEEERQTLRQYLSVDDNRADFRPDVKSKHPRWDDTDWPKQVLEKALSRLMPNGFNVEEITFRNDKIALKPHTDNGSLPNTQGKTIMFLLDADPIAHTVVFKNRWTGWEPMGVFFTKQPWSPFTYKIPNKQGDFVQVQDIRELLEQCKQDPSSVIDFLVDTAFINNLETLIAKRSLDRLAFDDQTKNTGYIQPGPRRNDYETLTHYSKDKMFDTELHKQYFNDIPIEDLHGLEIENIFEWQQRAGIVFDREQLHCSSSCHKEKSFVTIFCHAL